MAESEFVTATEAARMLGTTTERIARLVKRGILTSRISNLDRRRRLIPRRELEQILERELGNSIEREALVESPDPVQKWPITRGIWDGPMKITSDEVDEYLAKHWRP